MFIMPVLIEDLKNTYDSISRPVSVGLVRDLINRLGLPNDTRVQYTGSAETIVTHGSQLSAKNNQPIFGFDGKVKVDIDERFMEDSVLSTAVLQTQNTPVFFDGKLGVDIRPVYTQTELAVTFNYTTQSRSQANQWRNSLRRRSAQALMQANLHEFIYSYDVPGSFVAILREIWRLRENVAGYGDSFEQYLRSHFQDRLTIKTDMRAKSAKLSFPEKQLDVQGWFDFTSEPDQIQKEKEGDLWAVSFTYTVQFDKLISMVIRYPIVVHNQLMDKYIDFEKDYDNYDRRRGGTIRAPMLDHFSSARQKLDPHYRGVFMPEFDDWEPRSFSNKLLPILTTLIGVEESDPHQIFNFNDLVEYELSDEFKELLKSEREKVFDYLESSIYIEFFKGREQVTGDSLHLTEDLDLRTSVAMNPRDVHHVRINIVRDFTTLSDNATKRLAEHVDMTYGLVDYLDQITTSDYEKRAESGERLVDKLEVVADKIITKKSIKLVSDKLMKGVPPYRASHEKVMRTVMACGIVVHKK